MAITTATDQNYDAEVIQASREVPVLVDFWALWCGPCRLLSPLVDEAAEEFSGKLKVCKYNCDESQAAAAELGIRSIPTVIVYKDGKPASTRIGAMNKSELTEWLDSLI
ncbi:MAG: thioredoxin [Sutterellaceae bacterium]|nr:thioredoxin [Sutterellaceae bacterium]